MLTKWKRKVYIGAAVLIGLLLLFSLFSIQLKLDLGMILLGAALLIVAYTFYALFQYSIRPKKQIHIINKVSLNSPPPLLRSVVTYKLKISSRYEIEEKGKTREVNLDEISLNFNRSDHPKVYEYCMGIINTQIQKNLELVRQKHPDAVLLDTQTSFPEEMLQLKEKSEDR